MAWHWLTYHGEQSGKMVDNVLGRGYNQVSIQLLMVASGRSLMVYSD